MREVGVGGARAGEVEEDGGVEGEDADWQVPAVQQSTESTEEERAADRTHTCWAMSPVQRSSALRTRRPLPPGPSGGAPLSETHMVTVEHAAERSGIRRPSRRRALSGRADHARLFKALLWVARAGGRYAHEGAKSALCWV
ncbi:hypothetical protein ANANG_G00147430 [Anguilla anguilla]|uniref:Uncharacterized protein n=1 Tax=Anguilla anguilla TaxID=7936 RepID=A0A9D3MC09_ANGAN|nr:hypothetical protein ANANG_G00147430 [Anguilla anguilla]